VKYWPNLCNWLFTPLLLLISIALTVINLFSAGLFGFRVGWINLGTFGVALTSRCSGQSGSSILLGCSTSDSMSGLQSSSQSFGLSKSPFQLSRSTVSEMASGALSSSLSTGWPLILRIWRTFNIWGRPPQWSFTDKRGGNGDISDNLNAAAPSCWNVD